MTKPTRTQVRSLEAALAVSLWYFALRLLGLNLKGVLTEGGLGGLVGSFVVIAGSVSLAQDIMRCLGLRETTRGRQDLYAEAQAEISAEKNIRKTAEQGAADNGAHATMP